MTHLTDLISALPKAELHLHIEGSLEPEQMFEFAARNNVDLPFKSVEDIRAAYSFNNLQEFLDIYYQGMSVLQTKQDFHDLTYAYLKRVHGDNCRHVEIFFDPQGHTERGVAFSDAIEGILDGLEQGENDFDISYHLILSFLRHLSEEDAFETLKQAEPYLDRILGVGLDSSELGHPPSKFERVYAKAREMGLKSFAHAGEEGPPSYVYEALDLLKIDRMDHGNRSLEDNDLVDRLVKEEMFLTVCPLSNLKLCVVDDLKNHPLKLMLDKGIKATVNSDDPSYFGGYLNDNYIQVADALNLGREDIVTLVKNSFDGAYLTPQRKDILLAEFNQTLTKYEKDD
jgi:adenosine deaminase